MSVVDDVSQMFEDMGALSVTMTGADDEELFDLAQPAMQQWSIQRVAALFDFGSEEVSQEQVRIRLENLTGLTLQITKSRLRDCDWENQWQVGLSPIHVGGKLWICPSTCEPVKPDEVNIIIDPGMAFGTGSHETTRLCLEWLAAADLRNKSVLDFGCGTGVLGIAAGKLGAQSVVGVDIDTRAVQVANENTAINGVGSFKAVTNEEFAAYSAGKVFDIVIANILANTLIELKETLVGFCDQKGQLLLSGILRGQSDCVLRSYADFIQFKQQNLNDWVLLTGIRT